MASISYRKGEFEDSVMSSNDPFYLSPNDYSKTRHALNGRSIMISVTIFLVLVVWFAFLLHAYGKWFRRQPAISSRRRRFHFTGEEPARLLNVGLDSAVLETLPVFVYKPENFRDGRLECAVCLSELEENEKGRILPNCRHSFHVECIDMWFLSHSTCPLCRIIVQPELPVLESARLQQASVTSPGPISSGIHDSLNSEQRHSTASSGEEYNLQFLPNIFFCDRQKQMNDHGNSGGKRELIISPSGIEIPTRLDGV